ncbi:PAS domain-containing sensor histidine kinase [Puniceicoccus vermicola]|uniref:histidine kinase n=1 Tax=Puniceicoccus vermicola TaxID=388746 RepID=A0A7X1AYI1_9BACT|nr:PAS domain-containing sensor histidine kinase [Puniceicoccus vermicola]MBC2602307.1 PAS domain-containing sensor histidine kinase [Puniceicoccus vermicola]
MSSSHSSNQSEGEHSLFPFFEFSPDLLCIAGFDGFFKRVNRAVCRVLGYSEEELMKRPIRELVHPEDRELTARHRDGLLQGRPLLNFENRYVSSGGEVIWLSWNSIPVPESELIYAVAKNISHIKAREEDRNRLLSELTEANEKSKLMNYRTAHDIRSPVAGVLSALSLINTSTISDPETLEIFRMVERSAEDLKRMLDRYVEDLQKGQNAEIGVELIDLAELTQSATQPIDFLLRDSDVRLELDFSAYDQVVFNRTYLESIFQNLLSNSIKYAHPERRCRISIRSRIQEGRKFIDFSDNGIGFDSAKVGEHLFGLNKRHHEHSDSKGVGLYLVYHHMTTLGGFVSVDSEVDVGTRFTLEFPDL